MTLKSTELSNCTAQLGSILTKTQIKFEQISKYKTKIEQIGLETT